jgi:hypothetical protein
LGKVGWICETEGNDTCGEEVDIQVAQLAQALGCEQLEQVDT